MGGARRPATATLGRPTSATPAAASSPGGRSAVSRATYGSLSALTLDVSGDAGPGDEYVADLERRNVELETKLREMANLRTISATTAEAYERLVDATRFMDDAGEQDAPAAPPSYAPSCLLLHLSHQAVTGVLVLRLEHREVRVARILCSLEVGRRRPLVRCQHRESDWEESDRHTRRCRLEHLCVRLRVRRPHRQRV